MPLQNDTLDLVPDRNAIPAAIQWLETIAAREHWPQALIFALTISVDEALTNIVSYAFRATHLAESDDRTDNYTTPCMIRLTCTLFANQIQIGIIDNGVAYDPTKTITQPLAQSVEQAQIGGHGLRLMRHYLSKISYLRRDRHDHLTLIINVPPHAIPVAP